MSQSRDGALHFVYIHFDPFISEVVFMYLKLLQLAGMKIETVSLSPFIFDSGDGQLSQALIYGVLTRMLRQIIKFVTGRLAY